MMEKKLSIILLSYQSEQRLNDSFEEIKSKMVLEKIPYELIIMDDGSKDKSYEMARKIALQNQNVFAYQLSKNYTSPYSQFAGFELSSGACAVVIPDDLQRPLDVVVKMYRHWEKGAKIVIAYRLTRSDGYLNDKLSSLYYKIMNRYSNINFPPGGADGFLADREVVDILNRKVSHRNTSPIIEVLMMGFDPVLIPYDRPPSFVKSRWTPQKKLNLALDTFFASSVFPIKLISILGILLFLVSISGTLIIISAKLFSNNTLFGLPVPGWATLMVIIMFFNGMLMLSVGVLAEYIRRIFDEVKGRPAYIIKKDDDHLT